MGALHKTLDEKAEIAAAGAMIIERAKETRRKRRPKGNSWKKRGSSKKRGKTRKRKRKWRKRERSNNFDNNQNKEFFFNSRRVTQIQERKTSRSFEVYITS